MGLDVSLHVRGDWTPEQESIAEGLLNNRIPGFLMDGNLVSDTLDDDSLIVEAPTMLRYYGAGYERGDWPRIYAAIRILRSAFPSCTVHYGSDAFEPEEISATTDDDLERIWRHYLSSHGDDFRARWTL